jgi:hypothetical protein
MNKKYDRKKLEKIVDMIKINRTGITAQDWFKLAGWILKRWNYDHVIQVLPKKEIDLSKLNFNSIGENVYAYLQYHININIQELRNKKDKIKETENLEALNQFLPDFKIKKVEDQWLVKARENYKHKLYLLRHSNNQKTKDKLKREIQQMEVVVQARKHNIQLGGIGK